MPPGPAPADPGRDGNPAQETLTEELTEEEWLAWCEATAVRDEPPGDPDEEEPDSSVPWDCDLQQLVAECRQITAEEAAMTARAVREGLPGGQYLAPGRRGPGQPGSAYVRPGEHLSRAAGFGAGMLLDTMPACNALAGFAAEAAGDDDRYAGASDDELAGTIAAWDRLEAHASARKHAAVAEFIRRRPAPDCKPQGQAQMPAGWEEFAPAELASLLAESRRTAENLLELARDLAVKLPGTMAAFRDGTLRESKVWLIACATRMLDEAEARAAEAKVLDRAGRLTPGGLRLAIARAVMEVAPGKARKRREQAAKDARVQRWAEDSGNAALMGRELPPAEVLAADQRISAWARQLKKAGLEGSMDELRARAYLDLLLGKDSRPVPPPAASTASGGSNPPAPAPPSAPGPQPGLIPAGFAGRITLTIPLATLTGQADRPGEMAGIGPLDPWLARDLARAAARNPRTTWCVTITDEQGHAVGHGCARPESKNHARSRARDGPGFAFTAADHSGPPGGYGTWRLRTGGAGPDLLVALDPITTDPCDHRYQAKGHDPGIKLRHLSQVRHATCTGITCRRPAGTCDFEHNTPYEAGGKTCMCNGGPKCRRDHRIKQHPKWKADQLPDGTFRWTTPSGRQYIIEPTRYPI